jgi:hypothetical protein
VKTARSLLAEAACLARFRGCTASEALLLTDLARLGATEHAAVRLAELTRSSGGGLLAARADFARALAAKAPDRLMHTARTLSSDGLHLRAAQAATTAAACW